MVRGVAGGSMDYMRGIGLDEMRPAYHALSGLLRFVGLLTQGVALGWFIAPLRGLRRPGRSVGHPQQAAGSTLAAQSFLGIRLRSKAPTLDFLTF